MVKKPSKRAWKWIIAGLGVAIVAFIGVRYLIKRHNALPEGIASGNGRIEGKLVDVSAKEPLRVKEILVDEGALVKPGQVLVRLDTVTLESELAEAKAAVQAAEEKLAVAKATIVKQQERDRSRRRRGRRARSGWSSRAPARSASWTCATTKVETTKAGLSEAEAMLADRHPERRGRARERGDDPDAHRRRDPAGRRSPGGCSIAWRSRARCCAPGGKALTLVNLDDIYMEIFLPSEQAAAVKIGAEGRVTVDYDPKRAVAGQVSFVSPEAQFTPKQVETKSEREKLMFRVKIQLPKEVVGQYIERIKTGVRGVGYVKVKDSAVWPARLQNLVTAGPAVGLAGAR